MIMPYLILAAVLCSIVTGGVGWKLGIDHQKAQELERTALVAEAIDAANAASAEAISKLKVKNTTITNEVQHEIRTNTIYADCKLTPRGVQLANQALDPSTTFSLGDGKLPKADGSK